MSYKYFFLTFLVIGYVGSLAAMAEKSQLSIKYKPTPETKAIFDQILYPADTSLLKQLKARDILYQMRAGKITINNPLEFAQNLCQTPKSELSHAIEAEYNNPNSYLHSLPQTLIPLVQSYSTNFEMNPLTFGDSFYEKYDLPNKAGLARTIHIFKGTPAQHKKNWLNRSWKDIKPLDEEPEHMVIPCLAVVTKKDYQNKDKVIMGVHFEDFVDYTTHKKSVRELLYTRMENTDQYYVEDLNLLMYFITNDAFSANMHFITLAPDFPVHLSSLYENAGYTFNHETQQLTLDLKTREKQAQIRQWKKVFNTSAQEEI